MIQGETKKRKVYKKVFLWVIIGFIFLELLLRVGGAVYLGWKDYRNRITESDKESYHILALGESTTAGGRSSWPAQLEEILNNRNSKIKFKVFNEGIPGVNTAYILSKLRYNLDKYQPDMVISMIGMNDAEIKLIYKEKYKDNLGIKINLIFENLRIYRLGKWLLTVFSSNKINSLNSMNVDNQFTLNQDSEEDYREYMELGGKYFENGELEEAQKIFENIILEFHPDDDSIYFLLSQIYHSNNLTDEAKETFERVIELNPNHYAPYFLLGEFYYDDPENYNPEKAEIMFKKAIELNPNCCGCYSNLGMLYIDQGKLEAAKKIHKILVGLYFKHTCDTYPLFLTKVFYDRGIYDESLDEHYEKYGFSFYGNKNISDIEVTKYYYNEIYRILRQRDITVAFMQYPTVDVGLIKSLFKGDENIIFISNEENFKKALENATLENIFIDSFGLSLNSIFRGDYGHATSKGNRLIAENVADIILGGLQFN